MPTHFASRQSQCSPARCSRAIAASVIAAMGSLRTLLGMVTNLSPVTNIWILPVVHRTNAPKHRHLLQFTFNTFFGHADISRARQRFAITALLIGLVSRPAKCSSLLTLRTRNLLDLTSSCIHRYASSVCFNRPSPCLWSMCSVAFAPMARTRFHLVTQIAEQRHSPL